MAKRLTIREQQAIAASAKNRKGTESMPAAAAESTPAASESTDTESIASEAVDCYSETNVRDKQVNVKFTTDDLSRLKKAAKDAHRPVANYIYSAIMDKISGDGY